MPRYNAKVSIQTPYGWTKGTLSVLSSDKNNALKRLHKTLGLNYGRPNYTVHIIKRQQKRVRKTKWENFIYYPERNIGKLKL